MLATVALIDSALLTIEARERQKREAWKRLFDYLLIGRAHSIERLLKSCAEFVGIAWSNVALEASGVSHAGGLLLCRGYWREGLSSALLLEAFFFFPIRF